jgi:membrane-bound acyltransferase YfiQ involved in biofilm formation
MLAVPILEGSRIIIYLLIIIILNHDWRLNTRGLSQNWLQVIKERRIFGEPCYIILATC